MAKIKEKEAAQQLRVNGYSIKQIAQELHVSKSAVSVWCRDISLSKAAQKKLLANSTARNAAGMLAYSEQKRRTREQTTLQNTSIGADNLGNLSDRDIYCVGLGLYWGEGYKRGNREFGFTNSDPAMIQFYIKWLQTVFDIKRTDLILRVSINQQHEKRIQEVEQYWSEITNTPLSQFTKVSLIKTSSKKQYENAATHYGTLRVKVSLGSNYREQVLGAIKRISI